MPLIAYDRQGAICAVLHELYWTAPDGGVHAVDMEAAEAGELTDLWRVSGARGSAFWPEHLGDRFTEFRVVRESGRAVRLIHRVSGHVRHRGLIEDALAAIEETQHRPLLAARRRVIGDPGRPLRLDADGRNWAESDRDPEAAPPPLLGHLQGHAELGGWDADATANPDVVLALHDRDEPAQEHEHHDEQQHAADEAYPRS